MGIFRSTQDDAARDAIADLQLQVRRLKADVETLQEQHLKLRGTVYAAKRYAKAEAEEDARDTSRMSREELKRHLVGSGVFVPGKPTVHSK